MSEPETPPAPQAPAFAELFELSLAATVDRSVFRRAGSRPPPSFGAAGGLAFAAGAAALAVNLAHAVVSSPGLLQRFSPPVLAAIGVAGLGLYASVLLLLAVMFYALGNGFGGKGEFERALQAAAMISVLAPVQMLCNWFPAVWIAPAALAAWTASGALEGLFGARPAPARALCALLASAAVGLQVAGRALAGRARDSYAEAQAAQATAAASAELARSMSAFAQQAQAMNAAGAAAAPRVTSGLDLLRGGSDLAPRPEGAPDDGPAPAAGLQAPPPQMAAAAQAMQANAAGMLDALTPMISMLTSAKNLAPQQKADVKELQGLMQEMKAQMLSGKKLDNAVFAEKMSRYQALLLKVMAYSAQAQAAAPAAEPKIRLKLPQEGR